MKKITSKDITDEQFHKAVGYYAILPRDAVDFIDMIDEEDDERVLQGLYILLATPNSDQKSSDKKWNKVGASIVKGRLETRNIQIPSLEE